MNRADAVRMIVDGHSEPRVVIGGVGATSGALWATNPTATNHLYNMDFGYPTAVGLGLAIARPDLSVVTLEGDGSAIAGMSAFCTIAAYRPQNLTTVVFDNRVYGTGSAGFATPTGRGLLLEQLVESCGFPRDHIRRVATQADLAAALSTVSEDGPSFLVVDTDTSDSRSGSRPQANVDFTECGIQFQRYLRELEQPAAVSAGGLP
jgi:thiamine pyrophosphate-dependent acetolactate synthase large subunit-like protein